MTQAPHRIWAATPLDGLMKPETMYGWTTADNLSEWQSENEAEIELGCDDPLIYAEYILATPEALAASPEVQALIADAVKAERGPEDWLIHKSGRGWYRPNAQGYTNAVASAGRYSYADAMKHSHPNGPEGPRDGMKIKHIENVLQDKLAPTRDASKAQHGGEG